MPIPRLELTDAPSSGRQFRTLAPWLLLAATLAAVMLITGWWSHAVEGARSGRAVGRSAGEVKPVLATDARQPPTGTSAGAANAVGSAARTVPVACAADQPSLRASWPFAADLAGALAAPPWWIANSPIAGGAPCSDGYYDEWSQTWFFSLTATQIATTSTCVKPGR